MTDPSAHASTTGRTPATRSADAADAGPTDGAAALASERMRALLDRPLPAEAIRENTALVAASPAASEGASRSLLVFRIGPERLALDTVDAHRVVPVSSVRRIPHRSNDVLAGIANIGGELTLVARLATALGIDAGTRRALPAAAGEPVRPGAQVGAAGRFVVLGDASARWAFEVDSVEGVRRVGAARLLPPPATVRHAADGCTEHLVDFGDAPLASLLDARRLSALLARSLS